MKLIRNTLAAGFAVAAISLAACSSQHSSTGTAGSNGNGQVGSLGGNGGQDNLGSVGMHLTIGTGVTIGALNWTISNGTHSYSGTVFTTDDAGNAAQSVEFVQGGIVAGSNYIITLTGTDSAGDPCSGASAAVTVVAGQTSSATVAVTCTAATDAAVAANVETGVLAIDAAVTLTTQTPFNCPGINSITVSPTSLEPPQQAVLTSASTPGSGGTETILWTTDCAGASISNPTAANGTFACGSTTPGTVCHLTLTVGLNGNGPDGGPTGVNVCAGNGVVSYTETVECEKGGSLACFSPNPNACTPGDGGAAFCTNLSTDVNNCGTCGTVCPSGDVCTSGTCSVPPGTACTTAPCASSGPNSVQCTGNANGVCTPTEKVFVDRDIAKGLLTSGQLTTGSAATESCYECLWNAGCLDDSVNSDTGKECGDLSGTVGAGAQSSETKTTACINTLNCIIPSGCQNAKGQNGSGATDGISNCFCGSNDLTTTACSAAPAPPATGSPNGSCYQTELDGFGDTSSTAISTVLGSFTTRTSGAGMANAIFQCAGSNAGSFGCPTCF